MKQCESITTILVWLYYITSSAGSAWAAWTSTPTNTSPRPVGLTEQTPFFTHESPWRPRTNTRQHEPRFNRRRAFSTFAFPAPTRGVLTNTAGPRGRRYAATPWWSSCAGGSNQSERFNPDDECPSLFIFGVGYVATAVALTFKRRGWAVHGTCTDPRKVKSLGEQGIKAYIFDDWSGPMMQPEPLQALASATCVLSTVPPSLQSGTDPVLVAHAAELQWAFQKGDLRWVGYLSSTGVYGARGGGWVTEDDEPWPAAPRTKARLKAERSWLRLHSRDGLPVHVLRLAGIYGPGRSALDAVARHSGDIRLAGSDDGTMVSRVHVADIVGVIEASVENPNPGSIVNVADDLPSTRYETLAYGCQLLGYPRQDPDPNEEHANRRGGGSKRVDNGKMRALLETTGRSLIYADYRVGLKALHSGDGRPFSQESEGDTRLRGIKPGESSEYHATSDMAEMDEVRSELTTLSKQLSRLEATLEKVLAAVEVKVWGGDSPAGAGGRDDAGEDVQGLNETVVINGDNSSLIIGGDGVAMSDAEEVEHESVGVNDTFVVAGAEGVGGPLKSISVEAGTIVDIDVAGC